MIANPVSSNAKLRSGRRRSNWWVPYAFLVLPLILYFTWVIGPMFYSVYMSFTNADGISQRDWVGLRNYRRLFDDRIFWISFWNNVRWLVAFITFPILAGLGLALILNNDLPGTRFFKAGFFSPMVVSTVVIGIVWSWMYQPYGLINEMLSELGREGMPRSEEHTSELQ